MKTKTRLSLFLVGLVIWAAATLVFRIAGSYFFEGSVLGYWLNVVVTGGLYSVLAIGLMKGYGIKQTDWLQGAVCIALPGMLGEIPVLADFSSLMSNMQPETAGRYAAFLFGGYVSLVGSAWWLSTKARLQTAVES